MRAHTILAALTTALPACLLAQEAPAVTPEPGPHRLVSADDVVLHDAARDKDLKVCIDMPEGDGPWPLIVFSHGAFGSGARMAPLAEFWASHGYVVLAPTHEDSLSLRAEDGRRPELFSAAGVEGRARDVSFLIGSVDALAEKVPAMRGKVDPEHVGVGGHSYGAFTTIVVGGATLARGAETISYADARADALLVLSGQGPGRGGLHEGSWKDLALPMMAMTGTHDQGMRGEGPDWRRKNYDLSPEGDKWFVFIEGADHGSFTGNRTEDTRGGAAFEERRVEAVRNRIRERFGDRFDEAQIERLAERLAAKDRPRPGAPSAEAMFDWVKCASLAYWNTYLKGDEAAAAWLKSDALLQASDGKAKMEHK